MIMLFLNWSTPAFPLKYLKCPCILSPSLSHQLGKRGEDAGRGMQSFKSMLESMLECSYFYGKCFNCLDI